jgi:hypothetical protein
MSTVPALHSATVKAQASYRQPRSVPALVQDQACALVRAPVGSDPGPSLVRIASAELLDRFFEQWVTLTDDLVQHCSPHPGLLKLLERATRFHALVLARVADEDHPILGPEPLEEIIDLRAAR